MCRHTPILLHRHTHRLRHSHKHSHTSPIESLAPGKEIYIILEYFNKQEEIKVFSLSTPLMMRGVQLVL